MQQNKAITHIIQMGDSVHQSIHPKYLSKDGQLENPLKDFIKKLHKKLACLSNDCFLETEDIHLKNLLVPFRKKCEADIKRVLQGLENGTFTFYCTENKCPRHPTHKGSCNADLMEEILFATPGARNCVWFRQKNESNAIPLSA